MMLLENCKISYLYPKFNKARTTASMIWDLSDEVLSKDVDLTGVELHRFKKARKARETNTPSKYKHVVYLIPICIDRYIIITTFD